GESAPTEPLPRVLWLRIALLSFLYVVLYFGAGALIAWQFPAVRAFYENAAHIDTGQLALLQGFRGFLWALLALFGVMRIKRGLLPRAGVMAVLFAVLTDASLLFPNPFMPWNVRLPHFMEVGASEALYGVLATLLLARFGGNGAAEGKQ